VRSGGLVSIAGASHAGFSAFAGRFPLRLLANPDSIGCYALTRNLQAPIEHPFEKLGGSRGHHCSTRTRRCRAATALRPRPSRRTAVMITRLAALAFFESRFAKDTACGPHTTVLRETLARDFPERPSSRRDGMSPPASGEGLRIANPTRLVRTVHGS
jgi:hypothetical protein